MESRLLLRGHQHLRQTLSMAHMAQAPMYIPVNPPTPNHKPVLNGWTSYFHWYVDTKTQPVTTTRNQNEQSIKAKPHTFGKKTTKTPAKTPYRISFGSPHSFGIRNIRTELRISNVNQEKYRGERSDNNLSSISICEADWKPINDEINPIRGGIAKRARGGFSHFIDPRLGCNPMTIAAGIVSNAAFLWKAR